VQVLVRDNNVDQALRFSRRRCSAKECSANEAAPQYEKPSERRAREKAEAVRRYRKLMRKRMTRGLLVPLHRDYDGLRWCQVGLGAPRERSGFMLRGSGLAFDEPVSFEGEHHLVDGRCGDLEVSLHVGFAGGRRARGYRHR